MAVHNANSPEPPPQQPLRLLALLADLRAGSIVNELQGELHKVVKGVTTCLKSGKLVLTLSVEPVSNVPNGVYIKADVASKVPQPKRGADMLFTDAHGGVHHNNPAQRDMFDSKPRPVGGFEVDTDTGEITRVG